METPQTQNMKRKRRVRLQFSVSPAEKAAVKRQAKARGMSISEFLAERLLNPTGWIATAPQKLQLSEQDQSSLLKELLNPSPASAALLEGTKLYQKMIGK